MTSNTLRGMKEDRFLTTLQMEAFSRELESAGFKHVRCLHLIDPKWREDYRPLRPELDNMAWTVNLTRDMLQMPELKRLIDICERHGMTFWVGAIGDTESVEFYLLIGAPTSVIPTQIGIPR
jgi:hypothetical protein